MDFITKLPTTRRGNDSIAVIVCRPTRRWLFFPLTGAGLTAKSTAKLGFLQMRRLGVGLISSFLSDRGTREKIEFWTHLCRLRHSKKLMSTASHLETDGKPEIGNQELERDLETYCNYQQDDLDEWLIEAEAAINSHPSESGKWSSCATSQGLLRSQFLQRILLNDSSIAVGVQPGQFNHIF